MTNVPTRALAPRFSQRRSFPLTAEGQSRMGDVTDPFGPIVVCFNTRRRRLSSAGASAPRIEATIILQPLWRDRTCPGAYT